MDDRLPVENGLFGSFWCATKSLTKMFLQVKNFVLNCRVLIWNTFLHYFDILIEIGIYFFILIYNRIARYTLL